MLGKIRMFVDTPSPNNAIAAIMRIEVNGTNVPIPDQTRCVNQFAALLYQSPAFDAEISGAGFNGVGASGHDNCIIYMSAPVDWSPMEKGYLHISGVSFQANHTASYVWQIDSMMNSEFIFESGQLIMNSTTSNCIGLWINPHSLLADPHSPVLTCSYISMPGIIATQPGQVSRAANQICVLFDHRVGPIIGNKGFVLTEPNGGDTGVAILGAGYGFISNPVDVWMAHNQLYNCIDIGHGAVLNGSGNIIRGTVFPDNTSGVGLDYWGHDDIIDIQIAQGLRGITFEPDSYGAQIRNAQNQAANPIVVSTGSGHPRANFINNVSYQN